VLSTGLCLSGGLSNQGSKAGCCESQGSATDELEGSLPADPLCALYDDVANRDDGEEVLPGEAAVAVAEAEDVRCPGDRSGAPCCRFSGLGNE
jgi:hypothetical protein